MKNILGKTIKELRKSKKLTQEQLSELTGYKQNTISNHENGNRQLDENDIRVYAKALEVSPQTLFDKTAPLTPNVVISHFDLGQATLLSNYSKLNDIHKSKLLAVSKMLLEEEKEENIRILEKRAKYDVREYVRLSVPGKVSAGTGYWQEDDYDTMVDFYADEIPDEKDYDTVAVVVGHSMEPKIKNGDFLFIKLKKQIEQNKIGIFQIDGENYVKKLKSDHLESLNKDYDNIQITEGMRTIGEVIDIYRG